MPRNIPAALVPIVESAENSPVELAEVYLASGTLYFAQSEDNISFDTGEGGGAQTYNALSWTRTAVKTSISQALDKVVVKLDNVNQQLSQDIAAQDFRDRRLRILRVFRDDLSSGLFVTVFDGLMDQPGFQGKEFAISTRSPLDVVNRQFPGRVFSTQCNYEHYDAFCTLNRDAAENKVSGTVAAGSTKTLLVSSALTQGDNYWFLGAVEFTSGVNAGIGRMIRSNSQAQTSAVLRLELPSVPGVGDGFDIRRGCARTPVDCEDRYNNWVNFGGFNYIPYPIAAIINSAFGGAAAGKGGKGGVGK